MVFKHIIGKKFLAEKKLKTDLNIFGSFYFKPDISEKIIKDKLIKEPLETLSTINQYIDGAYTLIFYDEAQNLLWVIVDPYGFHRAYYSCQDKTIKISDNLIDFFDEKTPDFCTNGLHEYLRFLDISPPSSCFEHINTLKGGTVLKISLNDMNIETIDVEELSPPVKEISFDQAANNTYENLSNAMKNRINISEKIGFLLSGGIDSGLLAMGFADLGFTKESDRVTAYTVGFENDALNESNIAKSVADHLNLSHKILEFSIDDEYEAFFDIFELLEIPFADPAVIPTYLSLLQMKKDGVDSVMEGTGADGIIGTIVPLYFTRLLKIDAIIPEKIRIIIASILKKLNDPGGFYGYFDFYGVEEKFIRWKGWTQKEIELLTEKPCDFSSTDFYIDFNQKRHESINQLSRIFMSQPDYRVTELCRLMGFKPVFPYFDFNFRQGILSTPDRYKHKNNEKKALYKAILEKRVPRSIWDVPKHGFDYPFDKLLLYKNADLVKKYLDDDAISQQNLFNKNMIREYRDNFLAGDLSLKFKIWALVVFQCWVERHKNWF